MYSMFVNKLNKKYQLIQKHGPTSWLIDSFFLFKNKNLPFDWMCIPRLKHPIWRLEIGDTCFWYSSSFQLSIKFEDKYSKI